MGSLVCANVYVDREKEMHVCDGREVMLRGELPYLRVRVRVCECVHACVRAFVCGEAAVV